MDADLSVVLIDFVPLVCFLHTIDYAFIGITQIFRSKHCLYLFLRVLHLIMIFLVDVKIS